MTKRRSKGFLKKHKGRKERQGRAGTQCGGGEGWEGEGRAGWLQKSQSQASWSPSFGLNKVLNPVSLRTNF